ncbi:cadmium resistance transporter domain-containing protein [Trichoderma pleuroticola]
MRFGATVGEACATFAITNIDDLFVLVTFNAEAATSRVITPFRIAVGQFIGFTVIIAISMIGFGISLVLPPEPIGFLGLLPILLGIWKFCQLFSPEPEEHTEISTAALMKGILKVALITIMNGGDNIGTYIPLFAQVERAAIAVYIVVYYILLGVWCLAASLVMRQRHVLALVQKYIDYVIPLLYTGLGIFIIVKSDCYPWTIRQINDSTASDPGQETMAGVTTFILLAAACAMAWATVAKRRTQSTVDIDLTRTDGTPLETVTRDADASVH